MFPQTFTLSVHSAVGLSLTLPSVVAGPVFSGRRDNGTSVARTVRALHDAVRANFSKPEMEVRFTLWLSCLATLTGVVRGIASA